MAAASERFAQVAAAEGLAYRRRSHWYNSVPAHEAALWADAEGNGEAFRRAVYAAYFAAEQNIGSADVLAGIAERLDMASDGLRSALAEGQYREEVERQFQLARELGITGVPAYVAGRYLMVGAQPEQVYRQLIETARREEAA